MSGPSAGPALDILRAGRTVLRLAAVSLRPDDRDLRAVLPGTQRRRDFPDGRHVADLVPQHLPPRANGEHSGSVQPLDRAGGAGQHADRRDFRRRRLGLPPPLSRLGRVVLPRGRLAWLCRACWSASASGSASRLLGLHPGLFTSALGAQLTWTLPFGLFTMFAVVNRFNRAYEEAANDLGATPFQRLIHVTLPILLPGIIGIAMGAFTLSYDEYARTTLTIGTHNTLPLEIYALISSATSPTLFAIGTLTTTVSFLLIGVTLVVVFRMQRRAFIARNRVMKRFPDRMPPRSSARWQA